MGTFYVVDLQNVVYFVADAQPFPIIHDCAIARSVAELHYLMWVLLVDYDKCVVVDFCL